MKTSSFGPGRLSSSWLDDDIIEPWCLETTDPHDPGHRDAFLGNGFIGQRITVEGDALRHPSEIESPYPKCLVHGLWGESRLISPPRWALLSYHDGIASCTLETGDWKDYRQALDLKHGILETKVRWLNHGRTSRIQSTFYLSRTQPNLGVLSRVICPDFDGVVSVSDIIDADHVEEGSDWGFEHAADADSPLKVELSMGPRKRRVAVVSRLQLEGIDSPDVRSELREKTIARTVKFAVRAGGSYRITKVVALVTDREASMPGEQAAKLTGEATRLLPQLESEHRAAWEALWKHRIEVPHSRLQAIINSSLYQFYSHLRAGSRFSPGPAGLSAKNWSGHVFWDSDLWMFPVPALLNPKLARGIVDYRYDTLEGARRNASKEGWKGAMFAWESAEFGDETIPDLIFHHQHHVNSDVALAQWWYWKISGDEDFYRFQAVEVIVESAHFWASRAIYNPALDRYEIRAVCCADEFAEIQDNNAYTNYSAVKTLELASEALRREGREVPPVWQEIIAKMWIPFDDHAQRFVEYEGYTGAPIKQADTTLLVYPYAMPMSPKVKANTVDYYRSKYPPGNIMMAAAIDGIVDCELGRQTGGWDSLGALMPHFRTPFLLASESPANEIISFATGLGGLLQLIVMGFGGIRILDNGLQVDPCLPPQISQIKITGMHYAGVEFDMEIRNGTVAVSSASAPIRFEILNREGKSWMNQES